MKKILLQLLVVLGSYGAIAQSINDPFFEKVSYIGAFGTEDWTAGWANWKPQSTSYPDATEIIEGEITTNLVLDANKTYLLKGFVYVADGASITIPAGTVIRGDKDSKGTLIIEKGGKIFAKGTKDKPIVFTSNQAIGSRSYGDWGGLVICGKAKINVAGGSAVIEGGPRSTYGGNDDEDSSGVLSYVRIEFGGIPLLPDKEINGLTLGGVGSLTQIDHIQVSYNGDDSYEWFGGTVNAKYLIAFKGWDDDFDTDYGFRGRVQFAVALRDPNIADVSGSNCFESDNDGSGSSNTPITSPVFSNLSYFGPKANSSVTVNSNYKRAMHLRRNTRLKVYNSVFAGHPTGLFIDGTAAQTNATNNDLVVSHTIMSGMSNFFASNFERSYFFSTDKKNDTLALNTLLLITDPFNLDAPDFLPLANSPVLKRSVWYESEIQEMNNYSDINAFPVPFTDQLTIGLNSQNEGLVNIQLVDISGKTVYTDNQFVLSGQNYLTISSLNLQTGVYFLKVSNSLSTHIIKVLAN